MQPGAPQHQPRGAVGGGCHTPGLTWRHRQRRGSLLLCLQHKKDTGTWRRSWEGQDGCRTADMGCGWGRLLGAGGLHRKQGRACAWGCPCGPPQFRASGSLTPPRGRGARTAAGAGVGAVPPSSSRGQPSERGSAVGANRSSAHEQQRAAEHASGDGRCVPRTTAAAAAGRLGPRPFPGKGEGDPRTFPWPFTGRRGSGSGCTRGRLWWPYSPLQPLCRTAPCPQLCPHTATRPEGWAEGTALQGLDLPLPSGSLAP